MEKNLDNFQYNVIIANIHEAHTFFSQVVKKDENYLNLEKDYIKFLISLTPIIPHLSSECLSEINSDELNWPNINEKFLVEETTSIVVQINGKKRGILTVTKNISEEDLIKFIFNSKTFDKYLKENTIKKQFYVKNRLINFLT